MTAGKGELLECFPLGLKEEMEGIDENIWEKKEFCDVCFHRCLREAIKRKVGKSSKIQSAKAFFGAGVKKSGHYLLRKRWKWWPWTSRSNEPNS